MPNPNNYKEPKEHTFYSKQYTPHESFFDYFTDKQKMLLDYKSSANSKLIKAVHNRNRSDTSKDINKFPPRIFDDLKTEANMILNENNKEIIKFNIDKDIKFKEYMSKLAYERMMFGKADK